MLSSDLPRYICLRNNMLLLCVSDVNKEVLELYGLINYGHLRKRIGSSKFCLIILFHVVHCRLLCADLWSTHLAVTFKQHMHW